MKKVRLVFSLAAAAVAGLMIFAGCSGGSGSDVAKVPVAPTNGDVIHKEGAGKAEGGISGVNAFSMKAGPGAAKDPFGSKSKG